MKNSKAIAFSLIILGLVIVGSTISFVILNNNSNLKSNCDGNVCVEYQVNSCQGGAILDTKISIMNRSIIFRQNISSYCLPALMDPKTFHIDLSLNDKNLKLTEVFTPSTGQISRCLCPFGINGTISTLQPGSYNLTFMFDNRYTKQVHILKKFEINII